MRSLRSSELAREAVTPHLFTAASAGLTDEETTWPHHADTDDDNALPIRFYCLRVATCDVIYADMAFGERRSDWAWAGESQFLHVVGRQTRFP